MTDNRNVDMSMFMSRFAWKAIVLWEIVDFSC